MTRDLEGRVAVVTGAASGIGRASAAALRAAGAHVAALDIGDASAVADLFIECDVTDEESVRSAFEHVRRELGPIAIAHGNAGICLSGDGPGQDGHADILDLDAWNRTMAVNATGCFLVAKYAVPQMREVARGSIIFTASVGGTSIGTRHLAYTASKAAVAGMTRSLAVQYGPEGIRTNAICPGPIRTPLSPMARAEPAEFERLLTGIPLGRIGEPRDIGDVVAFLASDAAGFMNGAVVNVDGGMTVR